MAQVFKLNGTTIPRMSRGDWEDQAAGPSTGSGGASGLDGTTPRRRWVRHVWQADVLAAADFDTLYAAMGTRCSIDTPAHNDRNATDYRRYFGVKCERVSGRHEGPNFENVTAEFLVRV